MTARLGADAARMAYHDRQADYGDASGNLAAIGAVWGELLGTDPVPADMVALMLAGMKLVRATGRINRDDLVDACAYLMLADDVREEHNGTAGTAGADAGHTDGVARRIGR